MVSHGLAMAIPLINSLIPLIPILSFPLEIGKIEEIEKIHPCHPERLKGVEGGKIGEKFQNLPSGRFTSSGTIESMGKFQIQSTKFHSEHSVTRSSNGNPVNQLINPVNLNSAFSRDKSSHYREVSTFRHREIDLRK